MTKASGGEAFILGEDHFFADQCIDGILVNPRLPPEFDDTPNEERPHSHKSWWMRPFIVIYSLDTMWQEPSPANAEHRAAWLAHWPSGDRYDVRRLDGGAWDRSTWHGSFHTVDDAATFAKSLEHVPGFAVEP